MSRRFFAEAVFSYMHLAISFARIANLLARADDTRRSSGAKPTRSTRCLLLVANAADAAHPGGLYPAYVESQWDLVASVSELAL